MTPDAYGSAKNFNMPGFDNKRVFSKAGQLRRKLMPDIQMLQPVPGLFDIIGAKILDHREMPLKSGPSQRL
jgi:hypothetical protein